MICKKKTNSSNLKALWVVTIEGGNKNPTIEGGNKNCATNRCCKFIQNQWPLGKAPHLKKGNWAKKLSRGAVQTVQLNFSAQFSERSKKQTE